MRSHVSIEFRKGDLTAFEAKCEMAILSLGSGTKKATIAACEEILAKSLMQVPKDTNTLAKSAYYTVDKRTNISSYRFGGTIGYGGNGNPINPISGRSAASYMVKVHEDLSAYHKVGKAKFLEDPVREYGANNFSRVVYSYAKEALAKFSI